MRRTRRNGLDDDLRRLEREREKDPRAALAYATTLERRGAEPERVVLELFLALHAGSRAASEPFIRRAIQIPLDAYGQWSTTSGFTTEIPASYLSSWSARSGDEDNARERWREHKECAFVRYTLVEPLEQEIAWWRLLGYLGDRQARELLASLPPLDEARSRGWGARTLAPPARLGERFVLTLHPWITRELAIAVVEQLVPVIQAWCPQRTPDIERVLDASRRTALVMKEDARLSKELFLQCELLGRRGLGFDPDEATRTEPGYFSVPWEEEFRAFMRRLYLNQLEPAAKASWEAASRLPDFSRFPQAQKPLGKIACDMAMMAARQLGFSMTNATPQGKNRSVWHMKKKEVADPFSNGLSDRANNVRAFLAIDVARVALAMHLALSAGRMDPEEPALLSYSRVQADENIGAPLHLSEEFDIPPVFRSLAAATIKRAMLERARELIV